MFLTLTKIDQANLWCVASFIAVTSGHDDDPLI